LESGNIYSILEDIQPENRFKISVNMQRVWQTHEKREEGNERRNERMIAFIQKAKEMGFGMANSMGGIKIGLYYNCYVSRYYHTEINYDGTVYKCTARDYSPKYEMGTLRGDGQIVWNIKELSRMYADATFETPLCLACKYLPLCNGACPQKIKELEDDDFSKICPKKLMEHSFEDAIIDLYEFRIKQRG
jgi:uncharacterized protein